MRSGLCLAAGERVITGITAHAVMGEEESLSELMIFPVANATGM